MSISENLTQKERLLAKLSLLMLDAGQHVLGIIFDQFHPPIFLTNYLANPQTKSVLKHLRAAKEINSYEWTLLYPEGGQDQVSSSRFESNLLLLLLQNICHLSPPYPNGWNAMPSESDYSFSADVVRVKLMYEKLSTLQGVSAAEYNTLWKNISDVLVRRGGTAAVIKITSIASKEMTKESYQHYSKAIKALHQPQPKVLTTETTIDVDPQATQRQASQVKLKETLAPFCDRPEALQYLQKSLANKYASTLLKCSPLLWDSTLQMPLAKFHVDTTIVNSSGQPVSPQEVLLTKPMMGNGQHILTHGFSGNGNSTLCKMLVDVWTSEQKLEGNHYPLVIHLDLDLIGKEMLQNAIYKQLFSHDRSLPSIEDIWPVLKTNAASILFLLDRNGSDLENPDLKKLLKREIFAESGIIIFSHTILPETMFTSDQIFYNRGLSRDGILKYMKKYAQISNTSTEKIKSLIAMIKQATSEMLAFISSPFLCTALFYVYKSNLPLNINDIMSQSTLLSKFMLAMTNEYCHKTRSESTEVELAHEVYKIGRHFQIYAFECSLLRKRSLDIRDIIKNGKPENMVKFGLVSKVPRMFLWSFPCGIIRDYLAASHLTSNHLDDLNRGQDDHTSFENIPQETSEMVLPLLCGLHRENDKIDAMTEVFEHLQHLVKINNKKYETEVNFKPCDILAHDTVLRTLNECRETEGICENLAQVMPAQMVVRHMEAIPFQTYRGMQDVLKSSSCNIRELHIHLYSVCQWQQISLTSLAHGISSNKSITHLNITWKRLNILSNFLVVALDANTKMDNLMLVQHQEAEENTAVAQTWANLQLVCQNMNIRKLSLVQFKMPTVIYHLVYYFPAGIKELCFSECCINQIVANELSKKLQQGKSLEILSLHHVAYQGRALRNIINTLKSGTTLSAFILQDTQLDDGVIDTLAETLKLTFFIKFLNLSNCKISENGAKRLVHAILENKGLQKVNLENISIKRELALLLIHNATQNLDISGLDPL